MGQLLAQLFAPEPCDPIRRDRLHHHIRLPGAGGLCPASHSHQGPGHDCVWKGWKTGTKVETIISGYILRIYKVYFVVVLDALC